SRPNRCEILLSLVTDVVQFLECLRDVKLPLTLESIRDNLLVRSKDSLTMFMIERIGRSASPEPYLNMNAAGSKDIYANFSAAETKSKCEMCGPLYRKDRHKLFVFEQYRGCWVGKLNSNVDASLLRGTKRGNFSVQMRYRFGWTASVDLWKRS
ncbi:hypothetical protein E2986_11228, partial [Frieseomelitta varia]